MGSTQGKDRDEPSAPSVHDVVNGVAESRLPLFPLLVNVSAICGFLQMERQSIERADTE